MRDRRAPLPSSGALACGPRRCTHSDGGASAARELWCGRSPPPARSPRNPGLHTVVFSWVPPGMRSIHPYPYKGQRLCGWIERMPGGTRGKRRCGNRAPALGRSFLPPTAPAAPGKGGTPDRSLASQCFGPVARQGVKTRRAHHRRRRAACHVSLSHGKVTPRGEGPRKHSRFW